MASNNISTNRVTNNYLNNEYLKLYNTFNKICSSSSSSSSNCLDITSIMNVFKLLYYGMDSENQKRISKVKQMIDLTPKSMYSKSGVFIRPGFKFNPEYKNVFKDKHLLLDVLPTRQKHITSINLKINAKFTKDNIKQDFLTPGKTISPECMLFIKDQSLFKAKWQNQFDKDKTVPNTEFYIDNNDNFVYVDMMKKTEPGKYFTYYHKQLNSLFLSLPYANNSYKMLIIMPNNVHTKSELLDMLKCKISAMDIINFYYNNGSVKNYVSLDLPKFEFKSEWRLDSKSDIINNIDDYESEYLSHFVNPNMNLSNMCKNMTKIEAIEFISSSNVVNNEEGTSVTTETDIFVYDGYIPNLNPPLIINKNFIFIILNKENIIMKIGVYTPTN